MKKTFSAFGNCQADALAQVLLNIPEFSQEFTYQPLPPVHLLKAEEVQPTLRKLQFCDLLLFQNVLNAVGDMPLGSQQVLERLPAAAQRLSLPPGFFFYGYTPQLVLDARVPSLFDNQHDCALLRGFLLGLEPDRVLEILRDENFYTRRFSREWVERELELFEKRERRLNVDICTSLFVQENWRTQRLFFGALHPAGSVFEHMAGQVLEHLGIRPAKWPPPEPAEPPAGSVPPIYPSTFAGLNLSFAHDFDFCQTSVGRLSLAQMIRETWALYAAWDRQKLESLLGGKRPEVVECFKTAVVRRSSTGSRPVGGVKQPPDPPADPATCFIGEEAEAGDLTTQLARLAAEVLGLDSILPEADFFALGGDSLQALNFILAVEDQVGQRVPLTFLRHPTVINLVRLLNGNEEAAAPAAARPMPKAAPPLSRNAPPFQRWDRQMLVFVQRIRGAFERWALRQDYFTGIGRLGWWCAQAWVQALFYPRETRLIARFVREMETPAARAPRQVALSLVNHILYEHRKEAVRTRATQPGVMGELLLALEQSAQAASWNRYVRVSGMDHITAALAKGRGIILVGPHTPTRDVERSFASQFADRLWIVDERAYKRTFEQLLADTGILFSEGRAVARAAVAREAQQRLSQGGIVFIAGDEETPGQGLPIFIGKRHRQLVAGFAELAVATGASILPLYSELREDGTIRIVILPALIWEGASNRADQLRQIMAAYGAFLTRLWREKPSVAGLQNMRLHLKDESSE